MGDDRGARQRPTDPQRHGQGSDPADVLEILRRCAVCSVAAGWRLSARLRQNVSPVRNVSKFLNSKATFWPLR